MYTEHGHHIPNSPDDGSPLPDHKDDCGGIAECGHCAWEAAAFIPSEPTPGHVEPIKEGLPDPELQKLLDEEDRIEAQFENDIKRDRTSFGEMEMRHRFGYHKPVNPVIGEMHQAIRGICTDVAQIFDRLLPEGRAKDTAIRKLEEACMWANKAIAEMSPVVDE